MNPDSSYAKALTKRLARQKLIIAKWRAAAEIPLWQFIYGGGRTNQYRPFDMGGPRDQWLEQSPWDQR